MHKTRPPNTPNSPPCPATLEGLPYRARKTLQHEIPDWVGDGAVLFITINCKPRGQNQLAQPTHVDAIEPRSLHHQQSAGAWWVHLLLLMPDHLHALVSFPRQAVSIVPKPAESCRTEIHAFSVPMGTFSSGISDSFSSFFKLGPRAFQARLAYSRFASTTNKPIPDR